jgi:hypothetical protein
VKLELPLDKIGAAGGLLDGVAFWHQGGRVHWGQTSLEAPDGTTAVVWGEAVGLPEKGRERVRIGVAGLKAGARVRVLYEDRELKAEAGGFVDDFRGADLYQRYGGGWGTGYGDEPVALRVYEISWP